jgi:hypothetical protein
MQLPEKYKGNFISNSVIRFQIFRVLVTLFGKITPH